MIVKNAVLTPELFCLCLLVLLALAVAFVIVIGRK